MGRGCEKYEGGEDCVEGEAEQAKSGEGKRLIDKLIWPGSPVNDHGGKFPVIDDHVLLVFVPHPFGNVSHLLRNNL